jgi:hypothetical protein
MTNEQLLLLSRVRIGMQRAGAAIDLVRVTRDRTYLEAVLMKASELHDESAVHAAMALMAQLGMINGMRVMDSSLKAEMLRKFGGSLDSESQIALRGSPNPASNADGSSSQSAPPENEPGRFSTPLSGTTTGSSPTPVPGGKNYKRGLR